MFDEFKSAFQRHNNAHAQLIIINVVVFAVVGILGVIFTISGFKEIAWVVQKQFHIPAEFSEFLNRPWTVITYAFMHGGFLHILFNMLALYWFGRLFVEYLGSDKLVAVYVLGALFGAIFYLLAYNTIPFFMQHVEEAKLHTVNGINMVGASAAVNAIVVATAVLLPNYTFFMLFLGPVKIKYIAAVAVLLSILGADGDNAGGNIAHLGGALIGFIYIKQLQAGINWGLWITVTIDWFKDLFKSKPNVKVTYRGGDKAGSKKPSAPTSKASQAEIDIILDKISDRGYESLTKEEKEKLFNASKK
jgi:membrane associated rhomboid family serine protease